MLTSPLRTREGVELMVLVSTNNIAVYEEVTKISLNNIIIICISVKIYIENVSKRF